MEQAIGPTHRAALLIYVALFLVLMFPYWGQGMVVAPDRQHASLGIADTSGATEVENGKFGDFGNGYIPEISAHLNAKRSGWLALWTDGNELGRPLYHISGFSPAYLPTWLVLQIVDSPWRAITIISLGQCFLAGLFLLLWCREMRLAPMAGLLAAGIFATSPLFMYWLTFPMFLAVWCWSAGALLAVTRLFRRHDLAGWALLSFSAYSTLMTAYPQPLVFHAYILTGFGFALLLRRWKEAGLLETVKFVGIVTSALFVGGAAALPVYLDLLHTAAESARVAPDPSFFSVVLPSFDSLWAVMRFLVLATAPESIGRPVAPDFPFPYDGLSLTPLALFLAVVSPGTRSRSTWGWWLAAIALGAFGTIRPLHEIGVAYLGLNLSRSTPLGSILLPMTIIAAYGADALIRRKSTGRIDPKVLVAALSIPAVFALAITFATHEGLPIRLDIAAAYLVAFVLFGAQIRRTHPPLLMAALVLSVGAFAHPGMLRQAPTAIATSSPLVERIRGDLPAGARFAVAAPGLPVLAPNANATVGLPSVHSYNSLSPLSYRTLIDALGGEVQTYGRWNGAIAPDYATTLFWMSNIGLMLADRQLADRNLDYLDEAGGAHLHQVKSRMGCCLQVLDASAPAGSAEDYSIGDPRGRATHTPVKARDEGDLIEVAGLDQSASLLVLSQKYHSDWHALILGPSGWTSATTAQISGVFQGVWLPAGTMTVELRFEPYARFAWLAHLWWLGLVLIIGFGVVRRSGIVPSGKEVVRK